MSVHVRVQADPLDLSALLAFVQAPSLGGVAVFLGTVRDHHAGRAVVRLEYEAYPEMAEAEMRKIAEEAKARFGVARVAVAHRTGRLEIGETSVAVVVGSAHRREALEACRFVIDTLKRTAPIWKRELYEDGAAWIEGEG
ncbi:MAG TPA: molybdenum cofactor biosynthesis protein MoaE [Candidatus Polarisedimenticolaceae bacterium]|nr:molybdenum cofactor biosynthesis protein MoaE [Candidatus Polarisedimenticolaceae bacterium]